MAPSYTLTYFGGRGAAEFIRYIFAYGRIEYEDKRLEQAEWEKFKPQSPFGQMPLLEHGGKLINQSVAIGRYIAKQTNLAGKDDWENLEIDSAVDTYADLRHKVIIALFESDKAKKETLSKTLQDETIPFYLSRLESQAKKNKGYLAVGRLTWADFYFVGNLIFEDVDKTLSKYPTLASLKTKVESLPAVKKWIDTRPQTPW